MRGSRERSWREASVAVLLTAFLALDLRVALYHLTTEGWKSGLVEVSLALLVALLAWLGIVSLRGEATAARRRLRIAVPASLSAIAVFFLFLSLYHFTHHGARSGAVESSLAAVLLLMAWTIL